MTTSPNLPDPTLAAEKLLTKAGITGVPVDLPKVLALWSNLFLVEEELDGTGYLLPIGELGAEILINRTDREERKRFTIAHELGHWVLGISLKKKIGHFSQPKNVNYTQIEKWCDRFATNLLMPEASIKASLSQNDPILVIDAIARQASRFKVSEEAFFIRIWEVLKIQVALLRLSTAPGARRLTVERSYASIEAEALLEEVLKTSTMSEQLKIQPLVLLSISTVMGKIQCVGRKVAIDRVLLVLKWPDEGSDGSTGGTHLK
jgi:Zn-dependent peptidase ImmA (M78 family)